MNSYDDFESKFDKMYAAKNYGECHRMFHTLKGLSGTIGAIKIYNGAKRLEKQFLDPYGVIDNMALADLLIDLSLLLNQLSIYLPAVEGFESNKSKVVLKKLKSLAEESDYNTEEYFLDNETPLKREFSDKQIHQLKEYIENFEFDEAVEFIDELLK